jgi:glycosyltransferase involved in cell wall biosynthesis
VDAVDLREAHLKIFALMDTPIVSGPGRQLAALVAPLADQGVTLRPVVFRRLGGPPNAYAPYLERLGIAHETVTDTRAFDPAPLRQLRALIDQFDPDIVQTHGYRPTVLAWLLGRRGRRWKWLGFHHGQTRENLRIRAYNLLDQALLPSADHVVVVALSQAKLFARAGSRLTVMPNAVLPSDSPLFDGETSAALPLLDALPRPRIGLVGRLSPEKGVDLFLEAFSSLQARGVNCSAVIAGDGPERDALIAQARSLGVESRLLFAGQVARVGDIYARINLLVLPSRSEGLPNTLLEALAADLPVVATSVGAVVDVLQDPQAGEVVPPGDPTALADALARALAAPATAERALARRSTVARFSLDRRVAGHLQLYKQLLQTRR